MQLNSPEYRLTELAGTGPDDAIVDAYVGDVRDVCAVTKQDLPSDIQPTQRPGETVALTIADVKALLAPKPEPKPKSK